MLELWGIPSTSSLPSLPDPFWPWVVAPDRILYMSPTELNFFLMLNWRVWNKIVLTFNCVLMPKIIVWYGTVFVCYIELFERDFFWHLNCTNAKLWMFEIDQFICIKMDLIFYNLQWLRCHKTNPNQSKLKCVIMLNCIAWILDRVLVLYWIVWNRTVLGHWNRVLMINWIVWSRTVFDIETVLMLNWIVWNRNIDTNKNWFGIK